VRQRTQPLPAHVSALIAAPPPPPPPSRACFGGVNRYTCSFRPTLLFLLRQRLPTFLSFYHSHEVRWLLEQLAEPQLAFGSEAKSSCEAALHEIRSFAARRTAQKMFGPTLAQWDTTRGSITPPTEVELLLPAAAVASYNNPFGGRNLASHAGGAAGAPAHESSRTTTRVQREPNAHLLGL